MEVRSDGGWKKSFFKGKTIEYVSGNMQYKKNNNLHQIKKNNNLKQNI